MAWLVLEGFEGRTRQRVEVLARTPARYRIRALRRTRLAGRDRWLARGEEALVPHRAIEFENGGAWW